MTRTHRLLGLTAVLLIGITLRITPLYGSPYPFNPDGIIYAGLVTTTQTTGALPLANLPVDSIAFTTSLTTLATVTGNHPLYIAQPTIAVIGTLPALIAALLTIRLTRTLNYPYRTQTFTGVLAGILLAVEGLYLHRSIPVDEQTLGLVLVPLGIYTVVRAHTDRRYWLATIPILAVLPVLHNLETVITALALVILTALATTRDTTNQILAAASAAIGFIIYATTVTLGFAMWTPAVIVQQGRLTSVPGLFLAWIILVTVGVLWWRTSSTHNQRRVLLTIFGLGFLLLAANLLRPLFPGLPATPPPLLVLLTPLIILPLLATIPLPTVSDNDLDGRVLLALIAAPLILIGTALTAALTPEYLATIYRTQPFVHLPIIVLAAIGVTTLTNTRPLHGHPGRQAVVVAIVLLAATASIPIAVAGLDLLPYKGTTTPAELSASGYATTYIPGTWVTDDHLNRITNYYTPNPRYRTQTRGRVTPVTTWLVHGGQPPVCPTLTQQSWTTTGAQLFPRPPTTLASDTYRAWLLQNHVVYTASSQDPITLVIPRRIGACGGDVTTPATEDRL